MSIGGVLGGFITLIALSNTKIPAPYHHFELIIRFELFSNRLRIITQVHVCLLISVRQAIMTNTTLLWRRMGINTPQITSNSNVYSTACSDQQQQKQNSTLLVFCEGDHPLINSQ